MIPCEEVVFLSGQRDVERLHLVFVEGGEEAFLYGELSLAELFRPRITGEGAEFEIPAVGAHPFMIFRASDRFGEVAPGELAVVFDAFGAVGVVRMGVKFVGPCAESVHPVEAEVAESGKEEDPAPLHPVVERRVAQIAGGGLVEQKTRNRLAILHDRELMFRMLRVHGIEIDCPGLQKIEGKFFHRTVRPGGVIHHPVQKIESVGRIVMEHAHEIFPVAGGLGDVAALGIGLVEEGVTLRHEGLLIAGGAGGGHVGVVDGKRIQIEAVRGQLAVGIAQVADDRRMIPDFPDRLDGLIVGIGLFDRCHDKKTVFVAQVVKRRIVSALHRVQIDRVEAQFPEVLHPAGVVDLRRRPRKGGPEADNAAVQQKVPVLRLEGAEAETLILLFDESSIRFFRPDPGGAEAGMFRRPRRKSRTSPGEGQTVFSFDGLLFAVQAFPVRPDQLQHEFSFPERRSCDVNPEFSVDPVGFLHPDVVEDRSMVRHRQIQVAENAVRPFERGSVRLFPEQTQIQPVSLPVFQNAGKINVRLHQRGRSRGLPVDADHHLLLHMVEDQADALSFPFPGNLNGPFIPEKGVFRLVGDGPVSDRLKSLPVPWIDPVDRRMPADGHWQRSVEPFSRIRRGGFIPAPLDGPETVQIDFFRGAVGPAVQEGIVPEAFPAGMIDRRPRHVRGDGAELENRKLLPSLVLQKRLAVAEDRRGRTGARRIRPQRRPASAVVQIDAVADQRSAIQFSRKQFPRNRRLQHIPRNRLSPHVDIRFENLVREIRRRGFDSIFQQQRLAPCGNIEDNLNTVSAQRQLSFQLLLPKPGSEKQFHGIVVPRCGRIVSLSGRPVRNDGEKIEILRIVHEGEGPGELLLRRNPLSHRRPLPGNTDEFRRRPQIQHILISPVLSVRAVDHGSRRRTRDQEPFRRIHNFRFADFDFQRELCGVILPEPEPERDGNRLLQIRILRHFHVFAGKDELFRHGFGTLAPAGKEVPPAARVDPHRDLDLLRGLHGHFQFPEIGKIHPLRKHAGDRRIGDFLFRPGNLNPDDRLPGPFPERCDLHITSGGPVVDFHQIQRGERRRQCAQQKKAEKVSEHIGSFIPDGLLRRSACGGRDDFRIPDFDFQRELCGVVLPEPEPERDRDRLFQIRIFIHLHVFPQENEGFRFCGCVLFAPPRERIASAARVDPHGDLDFL